MIRNIKLTVSYDGSKFSGWQRQKDRRSVQEELNKAINKVTRRQTRVISAGRTDAGVHALGQVVNFLTTINSPASAIKHQLEPFLPDDIVVIASEEVDLNFHSRFSAKKKTYRYLLNNAEPFYPMYRDYKEHVRYELDVDKMREAASYFIGRHDFKAFMKYGADINTVRHIEKIDIFTKKDDLILEFTAESFLHNQIRIMVGALVDVGRGKYEPDHIKDLLEEKNRLKAGKTYPSRGLYLVKIEY